MPTRVPAPTPTGFFINLTKKDSLISSPYSKYQSPPLETLRESLFRDSGAEHINLSTKEEEIGISSGDRSILKSPSTERVYINLTIEDLEATTYFQHLFFRVSRQVFNWILRQINYNILVRINRIL